MVSNGDCAGCPDGGAGTPFPDLQRPHLMRMPEMAREITNRWISEVPSKMV